jgi:hypothetical protein
MIYVLIVIAIVAGFIWFHYFRPVSKADTQPIAAPPLKQQFTPLADTLKGMPEPPLPPVRQIPHAKKPRKKAK